MPDTTGTSKGSATQEAGPEGDVVLTDGVTVASSNTGVGDGGGVGDGAGDGDGATVEIAAWPPHPAASANSRTVNSKTSLRMVFSLWSKLNRILPQVVLSTMRPILSYWLPASS
jgi:hypothetical protein